LHQLEKIDNLNQISDYQRKVLKPYCDLVREKLEDPDLTDEEILEGWLNHDDERRRLEAVGLGHFYEEEDNSPALRALSGQSLKCANDVTILVISVITTFLCATGIPAAKAAGPKLAAAIKVGKGVKFSAKFIKLVVKAIRGVTSKRDPIREAGAILLLVKALFTEISPQKFMKTVANELKWWQVAAAYASLGVSIGAAVSTKGASKAVLVIACIVYGGVGIVSSILNVQKSCSK